MNTYSVLISSNIFHIRDLINADTIEQATSEAIRSWEECEKGSYTSLHIQQTGEASKFVNQAKLIEVTDRLPDPRGKS